MDLSISDDYCAPPSAAAPQSEAEKRVFRAAAFLKKAEQEAAASEHCVFGAKAAALELTKIHAKKVSAVMNATKRLKTAKAEMRSATAPLSLPVPAAATQTTSAGARVSEAPDRELFSPKAAAQPKGSQKDQERHASSKKKKSSK
jgi:hypothetical protein